MPGSGATRPSILHAVGTRLGPYEIVGALGAGGMGDVYRARDPRLERTVAIKVSREKFEERFRTEALSIAALSHPHICTLFDVGPDYLVMEHVEGKTLRGPLPVAEAVRLASQIADALEHAHSKGIIHRDLKPSNILVTKQGVKILDFGLAKRLPTALGGKDDLTLTAEGSILGTPAYMSPEQIEGKPADERSDIFAFGLVLYEMLTGKRAFDGNSAAAVAAAILERQPAPVSALQPATPAAVEKVVLTCLAKDPAERWQSVRELKHTLEWAAESTAPRPRHRRAGMVAMAALVVGATILAVAFGRGRLGQRGGLPGARPIRLHLAVPPKSQALLNPNAVSPDGQRIALMVRMEASQAPRLYVRRLDSLEPAEIPGSERGVGPFWSPDSGQIAFWKLGVGGLMKVNVAGGSPQLVCKECLKGAGAEWFGATWSATNVIVFSEAGKLFRVSAQEGDPEPLGALVPGETGRYWPQFLPDGRRYLYLSLGSRPEDAGIYVGALDSDLRLRLVASEHTPAYSPPGYLVYIKHDVLVAQPFDASTLTLSGEALPVLDEQIALSRGAVVGGTAAFSISANGVLAWQPRPVSVGRLEWFDRSGRSLGTLGDPDLYSAPVLSPDEKSVAICRGEYGKRDLWILDAASGASRRLTFDSNDECTPAWSPDGQEIAFTSNRRGVREIYRKRADGSGGDEMVLASKELSLHVESWSADGRFLCYNFARAGGSHDLFVLALSAEGPANPVPFLSTPAMETAGKFSPNGRYLAYMSTETGTPQVYVQEVMPDGRPGPGKWQVSDNLGWGPRWRPDGKELYFHDKSRRLMAVEVQTEGPAFRAGAPKPLGIENVPNESGWFGASRDGQRFLFALPGKPPEPIRVLVNWLPAGR